MHDTGTTIAVFIAFFSTIYLMFVSRKALRKDKFLRTLIKVLVVMNTFTLLSWLVTL